MKFSEYVGHEKTKKIKKNVKDNIIPTEKENIIQNNQIYLGFGINKKNLKRVYDYIKSWFVRYHIKFNSINPYLTLYLLSNIPNDRRDFIKEIKKTKNNIVYLPEDDGCVTIYSGNKNEIWLEYNNNQKYEKILEEVFNTMNIEIINKHSYVRLIEIDHMVDEEFLDDMTYSMPKFPSLRLGNIGLLKKRR